MTGVQLADGALVVLEGLDRAGKSTQRQRLEELRWDGPAPEFLHMPSGRSALTAGIYKLTEDHRIDSPLARQLLHLASHAEVAPSLRDSARTRGTVLDRWWWSTVAYGWHGADLASYGVDEAVFHGLIRGIWSEVTADVVFVFLEAFEADENNNDGVVAGYQNLAARHAELAVVVPAGTPDQMHRYVLDSLSDRGLLA